MFWLAGQGGYGFQTCLAASQIAEDLLFNQTSQVPRSIIEKFHSQNFNRIRIGIGSPPDIKKPRKFNTISHVLGNISSEENLILEKVYEHIIESLEQINTKTENHLINSLNSYDNNIIQ